MSCTIYTDMTETLILNPHPRQLPLMLRLWAVEELVDPSPLFVEDLRNAADEIERLNANNVRLAEMLIRAFDCSTGRDADTRDDDRIRARRSKR